MTLRLGQALINAIQDKMPEFKFDKNSTSSIDTQVAFYKAKAFTYLYNMSDADFLTAIGKEQFIVQQAEHKKE